MFSKIKDSILVLVLLNILPQFMPFFGYQVQTKHTVGIFILSLAVVMYIFGQLTDDDVIAQVFQEQGVKTKSGQIPKVLKEEN